MEEQLDRVYRFALNLAGDPHLAEDLTQECFLRVAENQSQLRDRRAMVSWMFKIVLNLWRDQIRSSQRQRAALNAESPRPPYPLAPDKIIEQREINRSVLRSMSQLPDRQRQVLYLKSVEDFSIPEIAAMLGISCNAAKSSLHAARNKLRRKLASDRVSQDA